jgi:predicted transcriptional regulator
LPGTWPDARREMKMQTFEFSIIVSGVDPADDDWGDRFYDNGCDDATVSFQRGRTIVDFDREAETVEDAIASAVEDVKRAGATVERIEPDPLVNLTDIADRIGVTRAAVSKYAKQEADFPPPVRRVTTATPLYEWAQVAAWLYHHDRLSKNVAIEALAVKASNTVLEIGSSHFGADLKRQVKIEEEKLELA